MRNPNAYEPSHADDRNNDDDDWIGHAHAEPRDEDDDAAEDGAQRVRYRPNPLPAREEDEEELAEADIMEVLDDDDLNHMEGPDA